MYSPATRITFTTQDLGFAGNYETESILFYLTYSYTGVAQTTSFTVLNAQQTITCLIDGFGNCKRDTGSMSRDIQNENGVPVHL